MMNTLILIALLLVLLLLCILLARGAGKAQETPLYPLLTASIDRVEAAVKQEVSTNRSETQHTSRMAREELSQALRSFETKLELLTATIDGKLQGFNELNIQQSGETRKEVKEALTGFQRDFSALLQQFNTAQRDHFFALLNKQDEQNKLTGDRMEQLRLTLEKKLAELQQANEKKLEDIRITVEEKLQKTLETRLGESFKLVSERLEAVHKGLGDMQQLATGVGDLKRVLTNVKTRGILGEYQLENILEQTLTVEQYAKNVKTKPGSNALVEFAVKLPGNGDQPLWLPIDSKFPKEDFELLLAAYDAANPEQIEARRISFSRGIKKCAADIRDKYIDVPHTTDFAILFLPFESLYAEVLRTPGLFESIRREQKVNIAGPTTLSAFLSSLQMGFRTLAIEKRSSEVWQLLGAVKTEFGNFGGILEKSLKKLQEASNVIEQAGVRSRAIERKLKTVQELPKEAVQELLGNLADKEQQQEENVDGAD